jgi:predicted DNA-binding protein (MmcQ/YjbR family)
MGVAGSSPEAQRLRQRCLGLPGASEEFPFGDEVSVFKVGGKMFALCSLDAEPPLQLSVKCDPELAAQLRSAYPAIRAGYHLNKRHWNTITLDGSLPDEMVTDLLATPTIWWSRRCRRRAGRDRILVRWLPVFLDFPLPGLPAGRPYRLTGTGRLS